MTAADHELLAAAFSAMLGVQVVPPHRAHPGIPKLSMHQLSRATYEAKPQESINPTESFDVTIKTITGMKFFVSVTKGFTVAELKAAIFEQEGIRPENQNLLFQRKRLQDQQTLGEVGFSSGAEKEVEVQKDPEASATVKDSDDEEKQVEKGLETIGRKPGLFLAGAEKEVEVQKDPEASATEKDSDDEVYTYGTTLEDDKTLGEIGVPPNGTIFLLINTRGGGDVFQLDPDDLAPEFNYDYTNERDDGRRYMRGAFEYKRPYGWKRYALKVLDRPEYGDNTWLGPRGTRTETNGVEWPVSYHGTTMENARRIAREGYRIGPRARFGPGVYSSPSIEVAERYATVFSHDGQEYKVVLQNRVNPTDGHLNRVSKSSSREADEVWVSPLNDIGNGVHDVRPYNVLTKLIRHTSTRSRHNCIAS